MRNGWRELCTHLSEYILRAFQFIQEDNVNVDHVMNVMRIGQGAQPIASPERTYAGGGEVNRYVLAAVLAKYFQPHCKQFTFLRTAEFCRYRILIIIGKAGLGGGGEIFDFFFSGMTIFMEIYPPHVRNPVGR